MSAPKMPRAARKTNVEVSISTGKFACRDYVVSGVRVYRGLYSHDSRDGSVQVFQPEEKGWHCSVTATQEVSLGSRFRDREASVSWSSIGAVSPEKARAFAAAILVAADEAEAGVVTEVSR